VISIILLFVERLTEFLDGIEIATFFRAIKGLGLIKTKNSGSCVLTGSSDEMRFFRRDAIVLRYRCRPIRVSYGVKP